MIVTNDHATTERAAPRNATSVSVILRPYASSETVRDIDGVMYNVSIDGALIETTRSFKPGTILIVRMLDYPSEIIESACDAWPRSMGLAEVRWQRTHETETGLRHTMGVRYF